MFKFVFIAILEGLLVLFEESELGFGELWGCEEGLDLVEDIKIVWGDRFHIAINNYYKKI